MSIESHADLVAMRRIGRIVALILREMCASVRRGMTTAELDAIGASAMKRLGARSAPQLTYRFPGYTCISVNEEIVHGVPGDRRLERGDVVKIDVTAEHDGYIADAARTVIIDEGSPVAVRLQACAVAALAAALKVAHAGGPVSVIGRAVEAEARRDGFAVVRELCGHGVGRTIHERPDVPNYENPFLKDTLTEGLVIAIEPMLAALPARPIQGVDGWTLSTHNGSLAVHEEHTVVIQRGEPLILTAA